MHFFTKKIHLLIQFSANKSQNISSESTAKTFYFSRVEVQRKDTYFSHIIDVSGFSGRICLERTNVKSVPLLDHEKV